MRTTFQCTGPPMLQIAVGIDPSLTGTAVCALNCTDNSILHVSTLNVPKGKVGLARLDWLLKELHRTLTKLQQAQPAGVLLEVFIEGYAFMAKGCAIFSLGELGGLYRMLLAKRWGGYYEVPPTVLKKFVSGKGNAKKEIMLEQTFRRYGIGSDVLRDNNQVDAYGLARVGTAFMQKNMSDLTKFEQEAIEKLPCKCTLVIS